MRAPLQAELDDLEVTLQQEAGLVLRGVAGAREALSAQDPSGADAVIELDDDVDAVYGGVERRIEALLACQRPVAGDLRLVLAMLHINVHLERMADYAVTIAKLTKLVDGLPAAPDLLEALEEMAERVEEMTRVALDAFALRDLARAESLLELDDLVDRANRRAVDQVLAIAPEAARQEWGLRIVVVARCLERIGDHAVDIGEQVAYLLTGGFREFTDASHPVDRA